MYLFIYGCAESSLLCMGFLCLWGAGATVQLWSRAAHWGGFLCRRARVVSGRAGFSGGSTWAWVAGVHRLSCSTHAGSFWARTEPVSPSIVRLDSLPSLDPQGSQNTEI